MKRWMILNIYDPTLYWSNEFGWVDYCDADSFTADEKNELSLPIDGLWDWVDWY